MNVEKQINYGIVGCCVGIIAGFAMGFPVFFQLSYDDRGNIGLPFMLIVVLACCIKGGVIGIRVARKVDKEQPGKLLEPTA